MTDAVFQYADDIRGIEGLAGGSTGQPESYGWNSSTRTIGNATWVGTDPVFSNQDINGLLSGVAWNTTNLTYSFPTAAAYYGGGYSEANNNFEAATAAQKAVVRYALSLVSRYTQLVFTEVTETSTTHATLRIANSDSPSTSWAYYPGAYVQAGDVWLGRSASLAPLKAGYDFDTILHELGHTLGLKHGHETDGLHGVLPGAHDSTEWSVMTYHSYLGEQPPLYYTNFPGSGNQTYMADDIAALQEMYGANFSAEASATVYAFSPATGEMFINGVGQGASSANKIYETVWDGGGVDTYDLSNYTSALSIDLRPGYWSTFSSAQLADLDVLHPGQHLAHGNLLNAHLYHGDPRSLIENASGGSGADVINGNQAANSLAGNGGADQLSGFEGDDTLDGGAGADTLVGGAGNDLYRVDSAADLVTEAAGAGNDTVVATCAAYTLPDNLEALLFAGAGGFSGGGNASADLMKGGAGDDTLNGGDGADTLDGLAGVDRLFGGPGNDLLLQSGASTPAQVFDGGAGYDTLRFSSTDTLDSPQIRLADFRGDTLASIERLQFSSSAGQTLVGELRYSQALAMSGHTTIKGGAGSDVLLVVADGGAQGVSMSLPGLSYETWTAGDQVGFVGGGGDDTLTAIDPHPPGYLAGGPGNDLLIGGASFENLYGGPGADTLDGGAGADAFVSAGGAGDDLYGVYSAATTLSEEAGQGVDTVKTALAKYVLGANLEILVYTGSGDFDGAGNGLDNRLTGGAGRDTLDGGLGKDTLAGGAGDDVYVVDNAGDVVIETSGAGFDTIRTSLATYALGANVEGLAFVGTGGFAGLGNSLANALTGAAGADTLTGGGGNDTLDGGAGADSLAGGAGDDVYVVDAAGDVVSEAPGGGRDTVRTDLASYTLATGVENLAYAGSGAFFGTGNGSANVITGGAGNDSLRGGLGDDTLQGGAGADAFVFSKTSDSAAASGDIVADFTHGQGDRIDVSGIDAVTGGADDAFKLVSAFSHAAGQLVVIAVGGGDYKVQGDLNGDGVADLAIRVHSATSLVAGDFVF